MQYNLQKYILVFLRIETIVINIIRGTLNIPATIVKGFQQKEPKKEIKTIYHILNTIKTHYVTVFF